MRPAPLCAPAVRGRRPGPAPARVASTRLPFPTEGCPVLIFQLLLSAIALVLLVTALIDGAWTLALIAAMMLMVALSGVFIAYRREKHLGRR